MAKNAKLVVVLKKRLTYLSLFEDASLGKVVHGGGDDRVYDGKIVVLPCERPAQAVAAVAKQHVAKGWKVFQTPDALCQSIEDVIKWAGGK